MHILEIEAEGMPRHVGPFSSYEEAYTWALQHVPNGSWSVIKLAGPNEDWA